MSPRPKRDLKFFTLMCLGVSWKKIFTFSQGRVLNTLLDFSSPYLRISKCENILCHTLAPISLTIHLFPVKWPLQSLQAVLTLLLDGELACL